MPPAVLDFLAVNWFALAVLAAGLAALLLAVLRRRRLQKRFVLALLPGALLVIAAVGALALPEWWAMWIGITGIVLVCLTVFALLLTGFWSRWIGWGVAVVTALGLGGFCIPTLGQWLWEGGRNVAGLEVLQP